METLKKVKSQKVQPKFGGKSVELPELPKPDPELVSRPRMDGGKEGLLDKIIDWLVGAGEPKER
jgi:hypothetical protein